MRRIWLFLALAWAFAASATTPPPAATFEDKVCRSDIVVLGEASSFKVVGIPGCAQRGDGRHLSMCEEVQVQVAVHQVLRQGKVTPPSSLAFHFGGGLFSVDALRTDLLSGPRYFFLASPSGTPTVYRTAYPWFLGVDGIPENSSEVQRVLDSCPAPNNSFKGMPLRGTP